MRAKFKFYNVGQGTFYGGAIEHNGQKFVVVYDCGSVSAKDPLTAPIDEFRNEHAKIDLLIVSHFDKDHVNGIERLIRGKRVDRIVLPYMPLLLRLALVARQDGTDGGYETFIANPTAYFRQESFNVGSIAYVNQGGGGEGSDIPSPEDNPKFNRELINDSDVGELFMQLPASDSEAQENILSDDPGLNGDNIHFLPFSTRLTVGVELWEFVFYHRKTSNETDISNFQAAVDQYKTALGNIPIRDLFEGERLIHVKKLYKKHIAKNVNYSSLCVFHQPMFRSIIDGSMITFDGAQQTHPWFRKRQFMLRNQLTGTLLTGDQFLKIDADFIPFYEYFLSRMNFVGIYQVPHHGSRHNWREMPCELNNHNIRCFVINHGYGRLHHPNRLVLHNLLTYAYKKVVLNNQRATIEYNITPYSFRLRRL